jgi:putative two-component system response regulator
MPSSKDIVIVDPVPSEVPGSLLVVDDEELSCRLLAQLLSTAGYECGTAHNAAEARAALRQKHFDLVLTDMDMPGESGIALIDHIAKEHPATAVVMVTGMDDAELAGLALHRGAYGYVIKPFTRNEILIAVTNAARRRVLEMAARDNTATLENLVAERTRDLAMALLKLENSSQQLRESRAETVHRLALAAEYRDGATARHVERMSNYCQMLALKLGFSKERSEEIRLASLMHDVGKIGVPDRVLLKPGSLDDNEWAIMKQHPLLGHSILRDSRSELLDTAAKVALTHHERADGGGYPNGIGGDDIPLEGRIASVADVFDALTSDRCYRPAMSDMDARDLIVDGRGSQFDENVVDLFVESWDEVLEIKRATAGV